MTRILRTCIALGLVVVVAACASATGERAMTGEHGLLVLSMGRLNKEVNTGYSLRMRSPKSGERSYVMYTPIMTPDFKDDTMNGSVFVTALAPGEYEIYNFNATVYGGATYFAKEDFSVPFTIRKDEVTYIGEYVADQGRRPRAFGTDLFTYFVVRNREQRDLALAASKNARAKGLPVSRQVYVASPGSPAPIRNERLPPS